MDVGRGGVLVGGGGTAHWPANPGTLQDCPVGHDATPQQAPFTQKPDSHCAGSTHGLPLGAGALQLPKLPWMLHN